MGITILKKKPGYTIALALCIIGALMLLIVVWKTWENGVYGSSNVLSALNTFLFTTDLWLGLQPIYYTILGSVLLVGG